MNRFEKRQLFLTCALTALYLKDNVREQFQNEWMREREEIEALQLKSVPSLVFNLVVSNEMRKKLGAPVDESTGNPLGQEFFYTGNLWILNIPSRFSDAGAVLPVYDAARRNIKCWQVFRHAKDQKPFIVGRF